MVAIPTHAIRFTARAVQPKKDAGVPHLSRGCVLGKPQRIAPKLPVFRESLVRVGDLMQELLAAARKTASRRIKSEMIQSSIMAEQQSADERLRGALLVAATLTAAIRLRGEPINNSPKVIATIQDSIKLAQMVLRSLNVR